MERSRDYQLSELRKRQISYDNTLCNLKYNINETETDNKLKQKQRKHKHKK